MSIQAMLQGKETGVLLYGHRIIVVPDTPKMQLAADVPVTPEFRAEMNAWMLKFFGTKSLLGDDGVVCGWDQRIYMSPSTYQRFRKSMEDTPTYRL